jgi:hypothetical protein
MPPSRRGEGLLGGLADDALVCRGGTCTAERLANGSGVTSDAARRLSGGSVNAGTAPLESPGTRLDHRGCAGWGNPNVRVVVDTTSGAVAQALDYDA